MKFLALCTCFLLIISPANAQENPQTILALADLTGPFASIGEECRKGYQIALKAQKVPPNFEVVIEDHARDPKVAVSVFKKFLSTKNLLTVITNAAPVGMALNPLTKNAKIPFFGAIGQENFVSENPYAFRFWLHPRQEASALLELLKKEKLKRIALVTLEDDYPLAVSGALIQLLKDSDIEVVANERVLKSDNDFSPVLTKLKSHSPDGIFMNLIGPPLGIIIRKARDVGITSKLFGTFSMAKKDVLEKAGTAGEGVQFVELSGDKPIFLKHLKEQFGNEIATGLNYACYASLSAALTLVSTQQVKSPTDLYQVMLNTKEFELFDEKLPFISKELQFSTAAREVHQGRLRSK